jgi:hypothetical protein
VEPRNPIPQALAHSVTLDADLKKQRLPGQQSKITTRAYRGKLIPIKPLGDYISPDGAYLPIGASKGEFVKV